METGPVVMEALEGGFVVKWVWCYYVISKFNNKLKHGKSEFEYFACMIFYYTSCDIFTPSLLWKYLRRIDFVIIPKAIR